MWEDREGVNPAENLRDLMAEMDLDGARIGVDPQPEASDRFGGLAWQVPDIDAVQARLAADRFDVSEIRTGNKPGTRVCTVRDPVHSVPTLLIGPVGAGESVPQEA